MIFNRFNPFMNKKFKRRKKKEKTTANDRAPYLNSEKKKKKPQPMLIIGSTCMRRRLIGHVRMRWRRGAHFRQSKVLLRSHIFNFYRSLVFFFPFILKKKKNLPFSLSMFKNSLSKARSPCHSYQPSIPFSPVNANSKALHLCNPSLPSGTYIYIHTQATHEHPSIHPYIHTCVYADMKAYYHICIYVYMFIIYIYLFIGLIL